MATIIYEFPKRYKAKSLRRLAILETEKIGKLMRKYAIPCIISLTSEVVFGVVFPILLPVFFGLDGLLYSFPAADILTFVIAAFIILRTYRELGTENQAIS